MITWNKRSPALHLLCSGQEHGRKGGPGALRVLQHPWRVHLAARSKGSTPCVPGASSQEKPSSTTAGTGKRWSPRSAPGLPQPAAESLTHRFPSQSLSFLIYNRKAFDPLKVLRLSASLVARSPSLALTADGDASPLGLRGRQPEKPLSGPPREYSASVHRSIRFIRTRHTPMSMAHVDDVIFHSCCITCFATLYGASALCFSCQGSTVEINPLWITNSFSGSPSDSPPA